MLLLLMTVYGRDRHYFTIYNHVIDKRIEMIKTPNNTTVVQLHKVNRINILLQYNYNLYNTQFVF